MESDSSQKEIKQRRTTGVIVAVLGAIACYFYSDWILLKAQQRVSTILLAGPLIFATISCGGLLMAFGSPKLIARLKTWRERPRDMQDRVTVALLALPGLIISAYLVFRLQALGYL